MEDYHLVIEPICPNFWGYRFYNLETMMVIQSGMMNDVRGIILEIMCFCKSSGIDYSFKGLMDKEVEEIYKYELGLERGIREAIHNN
jgi:hypothetical protein